MLKIYTDLHDHQWLAYILEEFRRISGAEFKIQVSGLAEADDASDVALYYTANSTHPNTICNKSVPAYGQLTEISPQLFVFEKTIDSSGKFLQLYDLFWNAFLILSRHEEYMAEKNGKMIRSYSSRHPRQDKSTFSLPLVNIYFKELEGLIKHLFPELKFHQGEDKVIEFSHDVDYIRKTIQLLFKQSVFNCFKLVKSIFGPRNFFQTLGQTIRFPFNYPSYFCFDYWKDLEIQKGVRSVFYVYARAGSKGFKSWLIDPSYKVGKNKKLQKKLHELLANGFEIGLHGSYHSAENKGLLMKEKAVLEEAISQPVTRTRQHWLNYSELKTPAYHNELFEQDSTLGWNDIMGFRSGCTSKYRPWDHVNNEAFSYFVVPQVLMDSTIFDYSDPKKAKKEAFEMLDRLTSFKNVNVAISWHQRTCSSDYKWHFLYKEIIYEYV